MSQPTVRVSYEDVTIPTYGIGEPDRNPMFLEKRVYQGSSGVVYPLPVIDRIRDVCLNKTYHAVILENDYLKIMILPELGGRLQMALDKTNQYHFIYYNRVIKPALVGLAGPWISGGLEFNWPQHHRPSTFLPVDCAYSINPDGSWTVWCSEIDRMHGTRGMHGFTLYPDRAYLEVKVRLFNRTTQPQTFLWWANPAVHVDENHQSVFPPDVHAVMDHGKRDVSSFPIATGTYYKVNYAPGTDISRYRNIPVPTSYMAYRSKYDFVGTYDHGRQAGLLHIASHLISPGKKQWTWGNGDFGRAWDRELTDQDGPYIELMCGVFTDNQPDFSWLMPGEERSFSQFFLPYKGVGVVKNATLDAAVGLECSEGRGEVRVYTTSGRRACRVLVRGGERVIWESEFEGDPRSHFAGTFELPESVTADSVCVEVVDQTGKQLVAWQPDPPSAGELPSPAQPIARPEELDSVESLYLAGVHLEQYRHATRAAEDYYREALRRDAGDARCNNALGRIYLRRGKPAQAESHLRAAIARLTRHNPNPYDGEPYYNLGLALVAQSQWEAAFEAFGKATWNAAWQDAAWFQMARLEARRGRRDAAMDLLDKCLARNGQHQQAIHLRFALLAQDKGNREAMWSAFSEHHRDPFNVGILYEMNQLEQFKLPDIPVDFSAQANSSAHTYLELAFDYAAAGLYARAVGVLDYCLERKIPGWELPMVLYSRAHYQRALGQSDKATQTASIAAQWSPDCCFPCRIELIPILQAAMEHAPTDPRAPYYLGNLWYHHRQYDDAIGCWKRARELEPHFPTVWRNLGLAYYNQRHDHTAARDAYHHAFAADPKDARVLYELDQLERRLGASAEERLARLQEHFSLVLVRDDLYLEYVTLLNELDRPQEAIDHILQRRFHPWEGGEGKVPAQFVLAITQLARRELAAARYDNCLSLLRRTEVWPASLGEGKLPGIQENNIQYWRGCALRGLGEVVAANESFRQAAVGLSEPTSPMFYNDQPPDMIFYQGLALRAIGQCEVANLRFTRLIEYGQKHLSDQPEIDFFAVSLPDFLVFDDDLQRRNEVHCRYMMALGYLGLEQYSEAREQFTQVLTLDAHHQGSLIHQSWSAENQL